MIADSTTTSSPQSGFIGLEDAGFDGPVDALIFLKLEHRAIEDLFLKWQLAGSGNAQQQIGAVLCQAIADHLGLERTHFFPMIGNHAGNIDEALHRVLVEHGTLQWLIAQLMAHPGGGTSNDARMLLMQECLQRYFRIKETILFPLIRRSAIDLLALGRIFKNAKAYSRTGAVH